MRFGVELEMVTSDPNAAATAVRDQLGELWAGAERDASVAGVECPTQPATIEEHRKAWPNFRLRRERQPIGHVGCTSI